MALPILVFIYFSLYAACYATGDYRDTATLSDVFTKFLGIITHVGNNFHALEVEIIKYILSIDNIISGAWRQMEIKGIAQTINYRMDFGYKPADSSPCVAAPFV